MQVEIQGTAEIPTPEPPGPSQPRPITVELIQAEQPISRAEVESIANLQAEQVREEVTEELQTAATLEEVRAMLNEMLRYARENAAALSAVALLMGSLVALAEEQKNLQQRAEEARSELARRHQDTLWWQRVL